MQLKAALGTVFACFCVRYKCSLQGLPIALKESTEMVGLREICIRLSQVGWALPTICANADSLHWWAMPTLRTYSFSSGGSQGFHQKVGTLRWPGFWLNTYRKTVFAASCGELNPKRLNFNIKPYRPTGKAHETWVFNLVQTTSSLRTRAFITFPRHSKRPSVKIFYIFKLITHCLIRR